MSGYFFDPRSFNENVAGYRELSPKEKWGVRVILDLMSASDSYQINDNDITFTTETGFTKKEWISVKQKIMVIDSRLLYLSDGIWTSKWLRKQFASTGAQVAPVRAGSATHSEIESFSKGPATNLDVERSILSSDKPAGVIALESPTEYAKKVNEELLNMVGK